MPTRASELLIGTPWSVTSVCDDFLKFDPSKIYSYSYQSLNIKKVIFNKPATIVIWDDGTKTVVKCMDGDEYSKDVGLAMCISKKALGSNYKRAFKKWVRNDEI